MATVGAARPRRICLAALLCVAFSGGCHGGSPQVDETCPIPAHGRLLMEQVAVRSLVDIGIATERAYEDERGVALSLPGRNFLYRAFVVLAREGQCLGPEAGWFDPSCQSQRDAIDGTSPPADPFSMTHDPCFRLGCESTRVGLVDVYLTVRPRTGPDDRHAFEYETTDPVGRMRYDPNPYVTYRVDLTDPVVATVSAQLRHAVTFTPTRGEPLDLSHTGTVLATRRSTLVESGSLLVFFTGFTPQTSPVVVNLERNQLGDVQGTARVGDRVLATVQGHLDPRVPVFAWQGTCDPRNAAAGVWSPTAP